MGRKTSDKYKTNGNEVKEVEEAKFVGWVKEHKKAILIGTGIVVLAPIVIAGAVAVVGAMAAKANDSETGESTGESDVLNDIGNIVDFSDFKTNGSPKAPHSVNGFVRNLHEGWKASPEKVAEAAEMGIVLGDNQTYVDSYRTGASD